MKLFLSSLASETLDLALPLFPDDPHKLKLAFIPTAADPYGEDTMPWMQADHDKLVDMGFQVIEYDIKNKSIDDFQAELADYDVIFVAGGNTFYLLQVMRKTGFDIFLKEFIGSGKVYIGSSAGSCVLCPTIEHVTLIEHPEVVPELTNYDGLDLVKELIVPHFGAEKYRERHEKIKQQWGDKVAFLRNDQALLVNGVKIELVTN